MKPIRVTLTNRQAYFDNLSDFQHRALEQYFRFHPPGYHFAPAYERKHWDGYIRLLKNDAVPSGLFRALEDEIRIKDKIQFSVKREFDPVAFDRTKIVWSDREYQNQCLNAMINAAQFGGGLVLNATATGKTYIAGQFFSGLMGNGVFIVDQLQLLEQGAKELSSVLDEPVGVIGGGSFKPARITVATRQTLSRHCRDAGYAKWVESLQVMIIDELHEQLNKSNFGIVKAIQPPAIFGLTATLNLRPKHIMLPAYALCGPVFFEYPYAKARDEGYVAKGVVVQVLFENKSPELSFSRDYVDLIVEDEDRNRVIAGLVYEARKRKKYCVALVERLAHLEHLSEELMDVPHRVASGKKEVDQRLSDIEKFEEGKIRVILANKVFKKGIDVPRMDVAIDGAAMKSKNDAIQKFGRLARLHPDKEGVIYFDISDVGNRFESAARSRKRAFNAAKIPVIPLYWNDADDWYSIAFDKAEVALKAM